VHINVTIVLGILIEMVWKKFFLKFLIIFF